MTQRINASEAAYYKLEESGRFCAINPGDNVLSSAVLSPFGFLQDSSEDFSIDGTGSPRRDNHWVGSDRTIRKGKTIYSGVLDKKADTLHIRGGKFVIEERNFANTCIRMCNNY